MKLVLQLWGFGFDCGVRREKKVNRLILKYPSACYITESLVSGGMMSMYRG